MSNTTEKISILIAEDHTLVREAWSFMFNIDERFKVVAQCSNGEDAIEKTRLYNPQIIIMDINLPGISGLETVKQIMKYSPGSKILAASQHLHEGYVSGMLAAGAKGYITKTSDMEEMFIAIMEIYNGGTYVCKEIKNKLAEQMFYSNEDKAKQAKLSKREIAIVDLIRQGVSSKEMAQSLNIAKRTVEVHRYNILKKLNMKNSPALVNYINQNPHMLWRKTAV